MSDAQIPKNVLNVPRQNLPSNTDSQNQPARQNVEIVNAPENIREEQRNTQTTTRIQGKVVRHNEDGSIRIKTERGNIDVRVPENQAKPPEGTRVEIEIPPTQPPKQNHAAETSQPRTTETQQPATTIKTATIRELPPELIKPTAQPNTRTYSTPIELTVSNPENRSSDVLQPNIITRPVDPNAPQILSQTLPPQGTIIRLAPTQSLLPSPSPQIINQSVNFTAEKILSLPEPPAPLVTLAQQNTPQTITDLIALKTPATQNNPLPETALPPTTPQIITPRGAAIFQTITAVQNTPVLSITNATIDTPNATPPKIKPQTFNAQIISAAPPRIIFTESGAIKPDTQNMILQNQKAGNITGIVTNITATDLPVLTIFFPKWGVQQQFTMQFPSENIALGTQIQIAPQNIAQNQITNIQSPAATLPLPVLLAPQPWPLMNDLLQTLQQVAPATAQSLINITPSPASPAQMGPAIMFFIAAIRGGDITQWLGTKATDILKTSRSENILNRLSTEGSTLNRIASETTPQDWRAANVPLYHDGDMHKIALYYKHEREDNNDGKSALKGTRFVFDLALENMGKVQVDGLFRPHSDMGKRLDLVLRTEEFFAENTKREMRRIYANALRETGVSGELSFQNNPESFVTIQAKKVTALGVNA